MLRDNYKALYKEIKPSDDLLKKVMKKESKKVSLTLLVACMLILSIPFMAFGLEPIELLYNISPGLAQSLKPVMMSSVDQGIEMTVISAEVDDKKAKVLIAFKDLEGDRLNGKFDADDSYYIKGPFDSSGHMEFIEYLPESKETVYLVEIQAMRGDYLPRHKISFGLRSIMLDQENTIDQPIDYDLNNLTQVELLSDYQTLGRGGLDHFDEVIRHNVHQKVARDVYLTGIGYVEDKLHVQLRYDNRLQYDNHGTIRLVKSGGLVSCDNLLYFRQDDVDYVEYLFDIDDASDYEIRGDFFTYTNRIDGHWEVTFKLDQ